MQVHSMWQRLHLSFVELLCIILNKIVFDIFICNHSNSYLILCKLLNQKREGIPVTLHITVTVPPEAFFLCLQLAQFRDTGP